VYKSLEELADDLPDHAPRFVLLSYPLTLVRIHTPHPPTPLPTIPPFPPIIKPSSPVQSTANLTRCTALRPALGPLCDAVLPADDVQ
jgi:hypothetical protein